MLQIPYFCWNHTKQRWIEYTHEMCTFCVNSDTRRIFAWKQFRKKILHVDDIRKITLGVEWRHWIVGCMYFYVVMHHQLQIFYLFYTTPKERFILILKHKTILRWSAWSFVTLELIRKRFTKNRWIQYIRVFTRTFTIKEYGSDKTVCCFLLLYFPLI